MGLITREGIVLTTICDVNLLVSPSRLGREFKRVICINDTAAEIWKLLTDRKSNTEIIEYFKATYDYSAETNIEAIVNDFEKNLIEKGYLINE